VWSWRAPVPVEVEQAEVRLAVAGDAVAARLGMPARWYARRFGPVQLVALDSTAVPDPDQQAWLAATLAAPGGRFRLVALHHPPYSAGWHGSTRDVRRAWVPLFRAHGVDVVLAGHEHDYQRCRRRRGVTYIVSGSATHLRPTGRRWFTAASHSVHQFLDVAVGGDQLVIRSIGHDRRTVDEVVLAAGPRPGKGPRSRPGGDPEPVRRAPDPSML
jgi:hypothetical protein